MGFSPFLAALFFVKDLFFFPQPPQSLLTLVLPRRENSLIRNDCLLFRCQCPGLSLNRFPLLSFSAVFFSSAWWPPCCRCKDKKLDLSGKLNVPSISTILLIFHQSCGSGSEHRSHFGLRGIVSNWQVSEFSESLPYKKVLIEVLFGLVIWQQIQRSPVC